MAEREKSQDIVIPETVKHALSEVPLVKTAGVSSLQGFLKNLKKVDNPTQRKGFEFFIKFLELVENEKRKGAKVTKKLLSKLLDGIKYEDIGGFAKVNASLYMATFWKDRDFYKKIGILPTSLFMAGEL